MKDQKRKQCERCKALAESLLFCVEQLENEDPDSSCMDNIAADQARKLLIEMELTK